MNHTRLENIPLEIRTHSDYRVRISDILFYFLFFALSINSKESNAQLGMEWQKCFGGSQGDFAYDSKSTPDLGFVVVGHSASNDGDISDSLGNGDILVLKLDSVGTIQWSKILGGSQGDLARSIDLTYDGGYIIGAVSTSNDGDVTGHHGEGDYWIIKLDSFGDIEWQRCYGGTDRDELFEIHQTFDSGFIVSGNTDSNDGDVVGQHACSGCTTDFWVLKLDSIGNIEWQNCLGGIFDEINSGITQTSDSCYITAGSCFVDNGDVNGNHGLFDYWVVKLSNSGTILWQKCIGGSDNDACNSVISTIDGGCLVIGESASIDGDVTGHLGGWDSWLVKLNPNGGIDWEKSYGGPSYETGKVVTQTNDSSIYLASLVFLSGGDISGVIGGGDYWVVKTDMTGNLIWEKCFGGTGRDVPTSISVVNDNELLLVGYTESNDGDVTGNHGGICQFNPCEDVWVVKIGSTNTSVLEINTNMQSLKSFYSNNESRLTLFWSSTKTEECTIQIFDITGKEIFNNKSTSRLGENKIIIPFETIGFQMYFVRITEKESSLVGKFFGN